MSAGLGLRVHETLPRLSEVLAIEIAFASQAAAIRQVSETFPSSFASSAGKPRNWPTAARRLSSSCERVVKEVHKTFPVIKRDRALSAQLIRLAELVQSGKLLSLAGLDKVP